MKKSGFLFLFVVFVLTACRVNNGDIGAYYGVWIMEACERDGIPVNLGADEYSWRFQNDILLITEWDSLENYKQFAGTWREEDAILYVDFNHELGAPPKLGLVNRGVTPLNIVSLSGKRMQLEYVNSSGQRISYVLSKLI